MTRITGGQFGNLAREFSAIFDAAEKHAEYFFPRKDKENEYRVFEKDLYKTQIYKNK